MSRLLLWGRLLLSMGVLVPWAACNNGGVTQHADVATGPDQSDSGAVDVTLAELPYAEVEPGSDGSRGLDGADSNPGDAPLDWEGATGDFGKPCTGNADCQSGFCIELPDGTSVCTMTCAEECPDDWACKGIETPPDWTFICVPKGGNVCKPCEKDTDCLYQGDLCVPVGSSGMFCGMDCSQGQPCPKYFTCTEVSGTEGTVVGSQCLPDTGSCICTHDLDKTTKECSVKNEWGKCYGEQLCDGANGWTECFAATPAQETCDGQDNDCDGKADEELEPEPCEVANGQGVCPGTSTCQAEAGYVCDAKTPTEEECDGQDNDCNGTVDEGFPDTNENGVADCVEADDDGDLDPDVTDCAPTDPAIHKGAEELCDGLDNNCNTLVDEGFVDFDKDALADCIDPDDDNDLDPDVSDCDPLAADIGHGLPEVCNGIDNDCDGVADNGFPDLDSDGQADCVDEDIDGDGTDNALDCAPLDPTVFPDQVETCNGKDDNCNGQVDEGSPDTDTDQQADCVDSDDDGDLDPDISDCKPLDPAIHHDAVEACDGVDNNCDGHGDEGCPPVKVTVRQLSALADLDDGLLRLKMAVGWTVTGTVESLDQNLVLRWGH